MTNRGMRTLQEMEKMSEEKDIRYQVSIDQPLGSPKYDGANIDVTKIPDYIYAETLDEIVAQYMDWVKEAVLVEFAQIDDSEKEGWFNKMKWHQNISQDDMTPQIYIHDRDEYGITNYDNWVQDDNFNPFSDVNPKAEFCPHCDADMRPLETGGTKLHSLGCPMSDAEKNWISNGHEAAGRISDGKGVPIQQGDMCRFTEKEIHTTMSGGRLVPACDICGSLPNEHGLCPMAQKTDEELDMERRVHGSAETCTRSYTVIPGYRGRMSRIQRDAWNEKNKIKLKPKLWSGEEKFTYDTKPVWKRTLDNIIFADFLDGNGIMRTNKQRAKNTSSELIEWSKEETSKGLFVYVHSTFSDEQIVLQSSYHASLKKLSLSKSQSDRIRDYYNDLTQWEGII